MLILPKCYINFCILIFWYYWKWNTRWNVQFNKFHIWQNINWGFINRYLNYCCIFARPIFTTLTKFHFCNYLLNHKQDEKLMSSYTIVTFYANVPYTTSFHNKSTFRCHSKWIIMCLVMRFYKVTIATSHHQLHFQFLP